MRLLRLAVLVAGVAACRFRALVCRLLSPLALFVGKKGNLS